jgi:hypothetical protein
MVILSVPQLPSKLPRGFLDYYLNTLEAFRDDDIAS